MSPVDWYCLRISIVIWGMLGSICPRALDRHDTGVSGVGSRVLEGGLYDDNRTTETWLDYRNCQ